MPKNAEVTISGTSYNGCRGTVNRVMGNLIEVYMPPQPTNGGRRIRRGTSWLFTAAQVVMN